VTGPDFTGVNGIIAEILVGHGPILIADQSVLADNIGVEVDLHFGVNGDGLEGGC
jgi:hypothetical protein